MNMAEQAESSKGLKALPMAFKYDKKQSAFEGIEDFHNHGHFIFALMESCANTAANLKQRLISDKNPAEIFAAGGGAKSKLWLKIISQKTKCKVTRSLYKEPATAGSVRLLQKN
jgi:sugar (pentulose or hexulose) kinase